MSILRQIRFSFYSITLREKNERTIKTDQMRKCLCIIARILLLFGVYGTGQFGQRNWKSAYWSQKATSFNTFALTVNKSLKIFVVLEHYCRRITDHKQNPQHNSPLVTKHKQRASVDATKDSKTPQRSSTTLQAFKRRRLNHNTHSL